MHSYYCTLEVSGMHNSCQILLCLKVTSAELLIERYTEIIKLFPLEFPYFHHGRGSEREREVSSPCYKDYCVHFLRRCGHALCAMPRSSLNYTRIPRQRVGTQAKDQLCPHTLLFTLSLSLTYARAHTHCYCSEAWLTIATAKNEASQDRFTHK